MTKRWTAKPLGTPLDGFSESDEAQNVRLTRLGVQVGTQGPANTRLTRLGVQVGTQTPANTRLTRLSIQVAQQIVEMRSILTKLVLKTRRDTAGGSTTASAAIGILRQDDIASGAGVWWREAKVGINTPEPIRTLHITGSVAAQPGTTGSGTNATWVNISGSDYELLRNTSAMKYKTDIDYNTHLADVTLRPVKYTKDGVQHLGFIADDLAAEDKLLGIYLDEEIDDYHTRGLMAVVAAKIVRLETKVKALT